MTAKEYLNQLRCLDTKINQKCEELSQLKSTLMGRGMRYDAERVQTSPQNMQENIILKSADLEDKIDSMIDKYIDEKDLIINQIHQLNDDRYMQILYLHYVPNEKHKTKRLEDIAVIMKKRNGDSYTYEHINRLHGEALQKFGKMFVNDMEKL